MRLVIQRVSEASVKVNNEIIGKIGKGLLLLIGFTHDDNKEDVQWMIKKTINMRIFSDERGKFNLSLLDINGSILVISQFTLYAHTKKGNRPSYLRALSPDKAIVLYNQFIEELEKCPITVENGIFGADMKVYLLNDGPVTVILDSKNRDL